MYQVKCRWSHIVVFSSVERLTALDWLEYNNDPDIFVLYKVK